MPDRRRRRASLPETVGAWLRVWTPPRDVEVPPVPLRGLLVGAVLFALAVAGAAALVVPRIDASKRRTAAAEARELAEQRASRRARVIAEQRARRVAVPRLRPDAGAPAAERVAARTALLARAQREITADARRRVATGELSGRPGSTDCEPYPPRDPRPERDLSTREGVYNCLVVVREIEATDTNVAGRLGYPFRAVLDFEAFSFVWCKLNPVPGEQVVPDPRTVVELPRVCRVR
jgi:hypothetical protein